MPMSKYGSRVIALKTNRPAIFAGGKDYDPQAGVPRGYGQEGKYVEGADKARLQDCPPAVQKNPLAKMKRGG